MLRNLITLLLGIFILFSCNNKKETTFNTDVPIPKVEIEKKITINYTLLISKDSIKKFIKNTDSNNLKIIGAINNNVVIIYYFKCIIGMNFFGERLILNIRIEQE